MASLQSIEQSIKLAKKIIWASGADEDVGPGLIVQYVGSEASGTVEVSSIGDITCKHGDLAAEVVDTTIGASGVMDVSAAAYSTAKEVEDAFNASPNWRARLTGFLPDDAMDAATGTLILLAATQAKVATGVTLYIDGTKPDILTFPITGVQFDSLVEFDGKSNYSGLRTDDQCENWLDYAAATNVFASGSSVVTVYEVAHGDSAGTLRYTSAALVTATKKEIGEAPNPSEPFIKSSIGHRLVVRIVNTSIDLTVTEFQVQGRVIDYGQQPRAM